MSSQFNAFEDAIDFSFWRELCEKNGKLRHSRCNEYLACTEEVNKMHTKCADYLIVIHSICRII